LIRIASKQLQNVALFFHQFCQIRDAAFAVAF
jgi:hypothetical protein